MRNVPVYGLKGRYLCQLVLAIVLLLFMKYLIFGAQSFSALQPSELEQSTCDGERITITGQIYKKYQTETCLEVYLKEPLTKENIYVRFSETYQSEDLKAGQWITVTGTVVHFQEAPNPGNFQQKFYYQKQNIQIQIREAEVEQTEEVDSKDVFFHLKETLWVLQRAGSFLICDAIGETYGGVVAVMLLGEESFLDPELKEQMQKSGIGHLLAISALHVSFVGNGCYMLARKLKVPIGISAIGSSLLLICYVIMSGGSTSAVRALVMFLLRMGATICGREYDGLTALAVAAIVLLCRQPVLLLDTGFLLSFGAVFAIYVIAPAFEWKVSFAIQAMLLPVQLYSFYEVCTYSLLWNIFAIPVASLILGFGFFGLFIKPFLQVAKGLVWFYQMGSSTILALPGARVISGQPAKMWIVIYYILLFWGIILAKKKKRRIVNVFLLIIAIVLLHGPSEKTGNVEITMLDVGQGDSFLIQGADGGTYMIDGGSSSVSKVGQYRLEPYLKYKGIEQVDYIWITHGDTDHVSGLQEMLERQMVGIRIGCLILPPQTYWNEQIYQLVELAAAKGTGIRTMKKGDVLQEGEMQIHCLWPEEGKQMEGNEASIVLGMFYGECSMLFTGDLEADSEKLVGEWIEKKGWTFDVLKVGHHGSDSSSSAEFLEIVDSEIGLISCGKNNRYGHPHKKVMERLKNRGMVVFRTDQTGYVTIVTDGENTCKIPD